jgi:hypothetical protein
MDARGNLVKTVRGTATQSAPASNCQELWIE